MDDSSPSDEQVLRDIQHNTGDSNAEEVWTPASAYSVSSDVAGQLHYTLILLQACHPLEFHMNCEGLYFTLLYVAP